MIESEIRLSFSGSSRFIPVLSLSLSIRFPNTRETIRESGESRVRTEEMGYKLTEDMGYTSNWADTLEKCVTDGTETAIWEFGGQRSFYGDGAVPGVWSIAQGGMKAHEERSRAPLSVTCRPPVEVERLIVSEKRLHPTCGPKKIRRVLETKHGVENPPVVSTVSEVLKRHGMVAESRRRGAVFEVERGALKAPERCNYVLGVDIKGWVETGDGKRCEPDR